MKQIPLLDIQRYRVATTRRLSRSAPQRINPTATAIEFSTKKLPQPLIEALRTTTIAVADAEFTLDLAEIDAKSYQVWKSILRWLRGRWSRKTHCFSYNPQPLIDLILEAERVPKLNPCAFFPTPDSIIDELFDEINLPVGPEWTLRLIESSAGDGRIARKLRERLPNSQIDVAEIDPINRQILIEQGFNVVAHDWLIDPLPDEPYDFAIINPPFQRTTYIDHIDRTFSVIKPWGKLASVAPDAFLYAQEPKIVQFRNQVAELGDWHTIGTPFEQTKTPCAIVSLTQKSHEARLEAWQPIDGYQSTYHRSLSILLETCSEWNDAIAHTRRTCSPDNVAQAIADQLDQHVARLIKTGDCLLYTDRVKTQIIRATLNDIQHSEQ